ncbi:UNVERIFIED_CONTAM: hypothetical protein Sindi_0078700 [Sesamum indicum]
MTALANLRNSSRLKGSSIRPPLMEASSNPSFCGTYERVESVVKFSPFSFVDNVSISTDPLLPSSTVKTLISVDFLRRDSSSPRNPNNGGDEPVIVSASKAHPNTVETSLLFSPTISVSIAGEIMPFPARNPKPQTPSKFVSLLH